MLVFYIIVSILWGILVFLYAKKQLGVGWSVITGGLSAVFWPIILLAAVIIEIRNTVHPKEDTSHDDIESFLENSIKEQIRHEK